MFLHFGITSICFVIIEGVIIYNLDYIPTT